MIFRNTLEERINRPGFCTSVRRIADAILEPSLIGLGSISLALNATNIPLDKFLEGDPKSVLYAAGIGALGATSAIVEAKKGYIRGFMNHRFKKNLRKVFPNRNHRRRLDSPNPGAADWVKTTALAGLAYMLTTTATTIPLIDKRINHPGNIPEAYQTVKSNVKEILGMGYLYEGRENGTVTIVEVPRGADRSKITAIDAQVYRMTSSEKARTNLGKAVYRHKNYCEGIIKGAHKKSGLGELGVSYELFVGLLAHESRLDQLAISYVGAAGIGQLMPWIPKQLGGKSYAPPKYQSNLKAYAHKLKKLTRQNNIMDLQKLDDRFDRRKNIEMSAEWLANLRRTHKNEDPDITLARYNTHPNAILFAKDLASKALETDKDSVQYNEIRHYLQEEGRMFSINVNATAKVMANPGKYRVTPTKVPW